MSSKKQEGNNLFKKGKYKEAVDCYKQYVSRDNDDNDKAYSNMALCYFKMKQYHNCIDACEKAVQQHPQFQKPYYRMYEAYKQLKDSYGMVISGSRFCKLAKTEKEIQQVQKQLVRVREELGESYVKKQTQSEDQKLIDEILSLQVSKQEIIERKQVQVCKESKWERIVMKVRENKREGLNMAMRFINEECLGEEERSKYRRLYTKLRAQQAHFDNVDRQGSNGNINIEQNKQANPNDNNKKALQISSSNQSQSEESPRVDQLQKYTEQQRRKLSNQEEKKPSQIKNKQLEKQQNPKGETVKQDAVQLSQPQNKSQNWRQFITQSQAQLLFITHIQTRITKVDDIFVAFYQSLTSTLKSIDLDRMQKSAILSLCPFKVKKFGLLMKSYSGKEKLQLESLFKENNLHEIWQKEYINTTNKTAQN